MRRLALALLAGGLLVGLVAAPVAARRSGPTIVETAIAVNADSGEFDTLIAAVVAADLVDVLNGNRQFTVFAPTDAAFAALGLDAGNIGSLDRATLTTILLHHVTAGRKDAAAVVDADSLRMLDGTRADVEVTDAGVFVDGAKVIAPTLGQQRDHPRRRRGAPALAAAPAHPPPLPGRAGTAVPSCGTSDASRESQARTDRPRPGVGQDRRIEMPSIVRVRRRALALVAGTLLVAFSAAPALACGGLIGPNGAVNLLRTTTFAGYHDGEEHYVTAFEFAGGGGAFGSLTPLPGHPDRSREGRRLDPPAPAPRDRPARSGVFAADAVRPSAGDRPRSSWRSPSTRWTSRSCAAAPTRSARGRPTMASGSRRMPPRSSSSTPRAAEIFLAAAFDADAAAERGQQVGDGTAVHITIPTDNPWVPLRILGLGKTGQEIVEADVYLLTDRAPALLPAPDGFNGLALDHSPPAARALLADLRSDRGHGVGAGDRLADQGRHRRRGAGAQVRPGHRCLRCRRAVPGRCRAGPAGRRRPDRRRGHPLGRRHDLRGRRRSAACSCSSAVGLDGGGVHPRVRLPRPSLRLVGGVLLTLGAAGMALAWVGGPSAVARDRVEIRDALLVVPADRVVVRAGRAGHVRARNDDPIDHEWMVGDAAFHERHRTGTEPVHGDRPTEVSVPAGDARTTTVTFQQPGEYLFICHLPGHEAYGMVGMHPGGRRPRLMRL